MENKICKKCQKNKMEEFILKFIIIYLGILGIFFFSALFFYSPLVEKKQTIFEKNLKNQLESCILLKN